MILIKISLVINVNAKTHAFVHWFDINANQNLKSFSVFTYIEALLNLDSHRKVRYWGPD